jgi:hypothetical protein
MPGEENETLRDRSRRNEGDEKREQAEEGITDQKVRGRIGRRERRRGEEPPATNRVATRPTPKAANTVAAAITSGTRSRPARRRSTT